MYALRTFKVTTANPVHTLGSLFFDKPGTQAVAGFSVFLPVRSFSPLPKDFYKHVSGLPFSCSHLLAHLLVSCTALS
jgi:hypothetical protein